MNGLREQERARRPNLNGPCPADSPHPTRRQHRRGNLANPVGQRSNREAPAAWQCCRWLNGMCDRPIAAAPTASLPAPVTIDVGTHLNQ